MKCHISNDPTKNCITEKFETFIRKRVTVFGLPRTVDQCLTQQCGVAK
jgi:hypothetical protein